MTKRAASSDLAVEEMMNLMILARVRSGPLLAVMGMYEDIKIWSPAWIQKLISLRNNASEFPERTMMLARWVMPSFGYVPT